MEIKGNRRGTGRRKRWSSRTGTEDELGAEDESEAVDDSGGLDASAQLTQCLWICKGEESLWRGTLKHLIRERRFGVFGGGCIRINFGDGCMHGFKKWYAQDLISSQLGGKRRRLLARVGQIVIISMRNDIYVNEFRNARSWSLRWTCLISWPLVEDFIMVE